MSNHVNLSDFGHAGQIVVALKLARDDFIQRGFFHVERGQAKSGAAGLRAFEDQLLVVADVSGYF